MKRKAAIAVLGVAFALLAVVGIARADAPKELCPATIEMPAVVTGMAGNEFGFAVRASSTRSVEGGILIFTDRGWFKVSFPKVQLTAHTLHYTNIATGKAGHREDTFLSPVMFMRFSQRVSLKSAFVIDARSFDDDEGWSIQGHVSCAQEAVGPTALLLGPWVDTLSAPDFQAFDTFPTDGVLSARPTSQFGSDSCPDPFADARVRELVQPIFPGEFGGGTSVIHLLIAPDGALIDATILKSAGVAAYDGAALRAARQSTYTPKSAYCQPVYGEYDFRVDFQ